VKLAIKKTDLDDERAILDDAVDPSVNIFVGDFGKAISKGTF
jgi:hypothetical protein